MRNELGPPLRVFDQNVDMVRDRPINAFVASEGKHVFDLISDPRIVCSPTAETPPDLVVFPCSKARLPFAEALSALAHELGSRVCDGRTVLVFDASTEGASHRPDPENELHTLLRCAQLPAERCIYITQDRDHRRLYETRCKRANRGVMRVLNYDYYIKQLFKAHERDGKMTFERRLAAFEKRSRSRMRRLISLNLSPRPTKVLFLLSLIRDGLWNEAFVSFSGMDKSKNFRAVSKLGLRKAIGELAAFGELSDNLTPYLDVLESFGALELGRLDRAAGRPDLIKPPVLDTSLAEYDQSWFTVVTETEMDGLWRITEKPFKAILNFHPALILGNRGALEIIKSLGFLTFPAYFDELYDYEPSAARRFSLVYEQVVRLCNIPERDLSSKERAVADTLHFNAYWGLVELPRLYRDHFDRALVDQILDVLRQPCKIWTVNP